MVKVMVRVRVTVGNRDYVSGLALGVRVRDRGLRSGLEDQGQVLSVRV